MSILFEPFQISGMTLKNRFVRSATYEAYADPDGRINHRLRNYMAEISQGGVGMVITSHAYVAKEGQAGPRQIGIYKDDLIPGLKGLADEIHTAGSVAVAQLAHAGQRGIGKALFPALGPSDVIREEEKKASAMTEEEIQKTIDDFARAAGRAVQAGFDGIQIHSAHSYLLSQFLSPYYNHRNDHFGGAIENRARFLIQVYQAIRKEVGEAYPVLLKINSEDFLEGGLSVNEMLWTCHTLSEMGIDAVEMSGGTMDSGRWFFSRKGTAKSPDREGYYREAAKKFKKELTIPLILVGGFLSYEIACDTVADGDADLIALSRPLICEPDLVNRWQSGDLKKAACVTCNKCFASLFTEEGLHCAMGKTEK